jgi:glutathione S-transferase
MMFEVLTTVSCRWSIRNIAALIEKGAEFRLIDVSEGESGRKATWYSSITPFGKTPALRHGERVVVESMLINEYVEEVVPGRPLLPRDPLARAWSRIWNGYCDQELMPQIRSAISASPEQQAHARCALDASLDKLETHLFRYAVPGRFWGGSEPSLTDFCYWSLFDVFARFEELLPVDRWLENRPRIRQWSRDVLACPSLVEAAARLERLQESPASQSSRGAES